ncbi:MAG: Lrp/AsnC family transcriptional regulator [Syntrophomonadaceae bacterium]
MSNLSVFERRVLNILQEDFPLSETPFADMATKIGVDEDTLLATIEKLKNQGIIRRIGGVIDSNQFGFVSTLCAVKVPEPRIEEVAAIINKYPGVTHNYLRDHDYNIWFTLTCPSDKTLNQVIASLEAETDCKIEKMPAEKVFKIKVLFDMGNKNGI